MKILYPCIIIAGCLSLISLNRQRDAKKSLAREVLDCDRQIDRLKEELRYERSKYSALASTSNAIIENLKNDVIDLKAEIKDIKELAEARIFVEHNQTIGDAISALKKLIDVREDD